MIKIVIAEDEDLIRYGLVHYIDWNSIGYELAGEASNGREAIEVINRVNPDVLLTDIRMPYIDGLTLIEEIKLGHPDIYFVILSGHDEFEYARRALKAGVCEFILKPLNIAHLKEVLLKIRSEFEKRQSEREELNKLKEIEQKSRLQFHRKMIHDILINHIPVKNIKEMSLLENNPEKNNYLIGIAEMENVALRTMDSDFLELIDIDREFGEKLERITGTESDCFLFKSGNCERLFCMEASNPQTLERKQSQILVKVKMKQEEPYSILMSFGTIRHGLSGMLKSYLEAREKQTNKDMKAWTNAIYPENKPINFTEFDTRALATEVQTGTRAGIDEQLKQLEDTLRSKGMTSHMFVMMVVSDIFFQIIKLPEGVEGCSNEILENPIDYYQKIINQKDLNGIFDYLKKICYQINDFFADINSGKLTGVLKRALDFIDSNFAREDLMIKDVAQYAYVSSSYLSIILKKEMGITFIEYLTKVRMEHAKKLLEENRLKQYEIAEACGYSNSTYFSTIFKRYFGVSPSGYLNKAKDDSQKG